MPLLHVAELAGRTSGSTEDIRVTLGSVEAPHLGVHVLRGTTPLNDPALPKNDPAVGAQVTQIRHDIAPTLQKQADAAWQAALDRCAKEGTAPTPQRLGSYAHTALASWIKNHQDDLADPWSGYRVRSEISFNSQGVQVETGTHGSVRPDIIIEREQVNAPSGQPEIVHVYDLKTGKAGISGRWTNRVTTALAPLDKPEELRPTARRR